MPLSAVFRPITRSEQRRHWCQALWCTSPKYQTISGVGQRMSNVLANCKITVSSQIALVSNDWSAASTAHAALWTCAVAFQETRGSLHVSSVVKIVSFRASTCLHTAVGVERVWPYVILTKPQSSAGFCLAVA
ncbi:hypothetical protein TcBrA4_0048090 [Trypanosoma cruzi]|nr:hypothetical protein TcBrA4_0048090 [Trypanosoma cruzi]